MPRNSRDFNLKDNKKEEKKIIYTNVFKVKETTTLLEFLILKMIRIAIVINKLYK